MAPPVQCGGDSSIRVWTAGWRRLGTGPDAQPRGACTALTEADITRPSEGPPRCPEVLAEFIVAQAALSLQARGIRSAFGVGACRDEDHSEEGPNLAVYVYAWSDADAAVGALLEQMMRWSVFGALRVSVNQTCNAPPAP